MLTLILISVLTALLYLYFKHKYSYWERRGLKGPKAYPIIGTFLAENKYGPKEIEERFLKEYGQSFGTYQGTQPVFNTSNVAHLKQIFSDLKTFPSKTSTEFTDDYLSKSILFRNDANWKISRSVQTFYFTGKKFRNLLPHFEKCSSNLLENLNDVIKKQNSNDIEVREVSKLFGLDVISKVLYSIDVDSYKERDSPYVYNATRFGELNKFHLSLMMILPRSVTEFLKLNPFDLEPIDRLVEYFRKMLKERRKNGIKYNDLSELLQDAHEEGKISENEALGNMMLAFLAGLLPVTEASVRTLYLLSEYQDVQDKLRNEVMEKFSGELNYETLTSSDTYLDAVVNESFRFYHTTTGLVRTTAEDTKLGEYFLEKGTEIMLITHHLNMSVDHYHDPMVFNPDRWIKGSAVENKSGNLFIPFGLGHKQCLGKRLALLELKYLIIRVLQHYKLSKPDDNSLPIKQNLRRISTIGKQKIKFTPIGDINI